MAIPLPFRGTGQGTSAEASSSFQQQKSASCPKSKEGKQVKVWFNKKIGLGAEHVGQREEMTVKASPLCVQRRKQIRFTQRTVPKKIFFKKRVSIQLGVSFFLFCPVIFYAKEETACWTNGLYTYRLCKLEFINPLCICLWVQLPLVIQVETLQLSWRDLVFAISCPLGFAVSWWTFKREEWLGNSCVTRMLFTSNEYDEWRRSDQAERSLFTGKDMQIHELNIHATHWQFTLIVNQ